MKDPSTPNRMQKAEPSSPACQSSKMKSPSKLTPRRRTSKNTTPKKNSPAKNNNTPKKRTPKKNTPKKKGAVVSPGPPPKIDLRLEAKLSQEEDRRVYAGRKIHPFFTLWKEERDHQLALLKARKGKKGIKSGIHIFEKDEDNVSKMDWSNWTFLDNSKVGGIESSNLSFVDSSVLSFDNIPNSSRLSSDSISKNELNCPSQLSIQSDNMLDLNLKGNEITLSMHKDIFRKSNPEPRNKFPEESMSSYYHSCEDKNSLWMHKYKPQKASEVCGNEEAVKFLRDWLQLWQEKSYQCRKGSSSKGQSSRQDDDHASKDIHEGPLQSVLLITGPIGSGKTAAVYACAQELGFEVTEFNASSCRSGITVENKLGEFDRGKITSSLRLLRDPALPSGLAAKDMGASSSVNKAHQTLTLFEDVDILFPEDRGCIATIQHFSKRAKGPIILTSNSINGGLPKSFARLHVSFSLPLPDELLSHMYNVCITEEADINPLLLKKFIQSCGGDIRKTIMQLQFWFQCKKYGKESKVSTVYGLLPFDVAASHQIIQKILSWNYPSELSELIEKEVAKSIARMEENSCMQGSVNKELDINERKKGLDVKRMNIDYLGAKVKRMKRSLRHCNRFESQHSVISEPSNCSGSPVTSSSQKGQSELVVMCSSSEKDPNNGHSLDTHEEVNKTHSLEWNSEYLCKLQPNQTYPSTSLFKHVCSFSKYSEGGQYKSVETTNDAGLNESQKSFNASCFPGSISIPEAIIQNEINPMSGPVPSSCHVAPVEVCFNNELTPITFSTYQSLDKLSQNSDSLTNTKIPESSSTKAVVLNSKDENKETTTMNNVIGECSHADFISSARSVDSSPSVETDMIQNLWRELRICQKDLGKHANLEQQNDMEVLKLTSGLTNLISEADILFCNQDQNQCGIMEPRKTFFDEATYSWYGDQMMMSVVAEHGFCFYAKHISDVGSKFGCKKEVDLTSEMLASSTNVMALGKLSREDQSKSTSIYDDKQFDVNDLTNDTKRTFFSNVIRSITPASSSYLTMKGLGFNEYISSLRQISISEGFRLSRGSEKTKKRRRIAPHYLTKGRQKLTPEDISLLCEGDLYKKISSQYITEMESNCA